MKSDVRTPVAFPGAVAAGASSTIVPAAIVKRKLTHRSAIGRRNSASSAGRAGRQWTNPVSSRTTRRATKNAVPARGLFAASSAKPGIPRRRSGQRWCSRRLRNAQASRASSTAKAAATATAINHRDTGPGSAPASSANSNPTNARIASRLAARRRSNRRHPREEDFIHFISCGRPSHDLSSLARPEAAIRGPMTPSAVLRIEGAARWRGESAEGGGA